MTDAEAKRRYMEYINNPEYTNHKLEWDKLPKDSKKVWKILLDPANRRVNKT